MMLEPELRFVANVPRWTIVPMNRPGTVAEHQYFVALYTLRVVQLLREQVKSPLAFNLRFERMVAYALVHDFDEIITGDIPSPTKIALKADPAAWGTFKRWLKETLRHMIPWVVELQDDLCLTNDELNVIKFCDFLEAALKLREDFTRGNQQVGPHFTYIEEACKKFVNENFDDATEEALVSIFDDAVRRIELPEDIKVVGTF